MNTPGVYQWQAYRIEHGGGADGCLESAVRHFTIKPKALLARSQARLAGSFDTAMRVASVSGIDVKVGTTLDLTWKFVPRCTAGACNTTMSSRVSHPSLDEHTAGVSLPRRGASYAGSGRATLAECSVEDVYGPVHVQLQVTNGAWIDGRWRATRFVGTMQFEASEQTAAGGTIHCPGARLRASVRGELQ
jgi:hypothetical protein